MLTPDDYEYLREVVREGSLDHFRFVRQQGETLAPDEVEDERWWTALQAKLLAEDEDRLDLEELEVLYEQFGFLDDPHYEDDEDDAAAGRIRGRLRRLVDQRRGDWEAAARRKQDRIFRSMF